MGTITHKAGRVAGQLTDRDSSRNRRKMKYAYGYTACLQM